MHFRPYKACCRLGLGLLTAFGSCATAAAVDIRLRPVATVASPIITLGHIADINTANAVEKQRLARMELAVLAHGDEAELSLREVQDHLTLAGVDWREVRLSGASVVRVSAKSLPANHRSDPLAPQAALVVENRVVEGIRNHLTAQAGQRDWQVVVRLTPSQVKRLAAAPASTPLRVSGGAAPWIGPQSFTVFFETPEGREAQAVTARVSATARAVVAARSLQRGDVLTANDVRWEETADILPTLDALTDMAYAIGKELVRPVAAGERLRQRNVRAPLLIKQNEIVTILSCAPSVTVTATARAMEDGSRGDLITLQSLTDRSRLTAVVSGMQEATVYGRGMRAPSAPFRQATPGSRAVQGVSSIEERGTTWR